VLTRPEGIQKPHIPSEDKKSENIFKSLELDKTYSISNLSES
jgi:hypothetical protein